jgi:protein TonB
MTRKRRQDIVILGFMLLSLLLHMLLLMLPKLSTPPKAEPVYVEVRPPQVRDRELDIPIRKELEKPRETPAKRLAEKDQVVEREQAPEGQDNEDMQPSVASKPAPPQQPPPSEPTPKQQPKEKPTETNPLDIPETSRGEWASKKKPQDQPAAKPLPDLKTLTQISPQALASIERDWRSKYRKDVAKGDTVWMDTEQDLLSSFMRRFRDKIYLVWNYPAAASERNQQGTCLLRITIDRKGNVENVQLLESSGHRILDDEAIRAVKKGSTYGPLPRVYPNEKLNIMAFFRYEQGRGRSRGRMY